jgi:hypothetical protein
VISPAKRNPRSSNGRAARSREPPSPQEAARVVSAAQQAVGFERLRPMEQMLSDRFHDLSVSRTEVTLQGESEQQLSGRSISIEPTNLSNSFAKERRGNHPFVSYAPISAEPGCGTGQTLQGKSGHLVLQLTHSDLCADTRI